MKCKNCGAESFENRICEYCGSIVNENGLPPKDSIQHSGEPAFLYSGDSAFYNTERETTTLLGKSVHNLFVGDVLSFEEENYKILEIRHIVQGQVPYVNEKTMCAVMLNGIIKEKDLQKAIRKHTYEAEECRCMFFTFR